MPSSMTHTYFSEEVYRKLPKNCQNKIKNIEYLKIFSQGSDPLMFYNYLIGPKSKYYKKIQNLIHTTKTQDFFLNLINYIHKNKLNNNEQVISYLYGNICHYFLDLETHPYIFYKTGVFNPKIKETQKYNALHQKMEYLIDIYYINKFENIPSHKVKVHDKIFKFYPFSKYLTDTINHTISTTYNLENITPPYIKSIKNMKTFSKLCNYDPIGFKKDIYALIDLITPKSIINLKELSFHVDYKESLKYLNLEHKTWNHPTNKEETYTYSFIDLYNKALNETTKTISEVTSLLEKKSLNQTKLKQLFTNLSYLTGKECNNINKPKHFEF